MANTLNRVEERQQRLESVLLWEGRVDNARVRDLFAVQAVQASRVLREFCEAHPDGVRRDASLAAYVATPRFRAVHASGTLDEYLAQLDFGSPLREVISDTREELAQPSPQVFSVLVSASAGRAPVKMLYRSMSTPQGRHRLIYPHAVVRAGRRWHVRAWCFEREQFRDFAVTRVESARLAPEAPPCPAVADRGWDTKVGLELVAHPLLPAKQAELIEFENFGGRSSRSLTLRSCLVEYVVQDLRAAVDLDRQQPPEYQLAVKNLAAMEPYLFRSEFHHL